MTIEKRHFARLHLFGPLRLRATDGTDATPRGQKARGLLAMLALARDGRLARATAAARLWSGSHDAKANLRQCLRELRAALDAADAGLLQTDDQTLALDRGRLVIDALALDEAAADRRLELDRLDDDCLLRDIEIADPAFEDWLTPERARCRDRLHQALEARADACLAQADAAGAVRWATRLIGFDPTLETAHRILMRGHADQGNRSLALRQFEICRERLEADLGVGPSEATLALRAVIARPPERRPVLQPARQPGRHANEGTGEPQRWNLDWLARHRLGPPILCADMAIRVALAPFNVLSETRGDQIHAMIVGEAVTAALARSTDLAIVDSAETSRAPAVAYRVDGSVARLGDTRRLTVRLWRSLDGVLIWVEHFPLDGLADSEALDQLAHRVASRLEEAVLSREELAADRAVGPAHLSSRLAANAPA